MLILYISLIALCLAVLVYGLRSAHSVGAVKEKLALSEREVKKLSWDKESMEKQLERAKQKAKSLQVQVERMKKEMAENVPEHMRKFATGQPVTAVDVLLRDKIVSPSDVEEIRQSMQSSPMKMDIEGAMVFKEKVDSQTMMQAQEAARNHNAKLSRPDNGK